MTVRDIILQRRAYRSLTKVEITPQMIEDLAEMASLCCSANNRQPWRFVFVTEPDLLQRLGETLHKSNSWAKNGSMFVAVCSSKELGTTINDSLIAPDVPNAGKLDGPGSQRDYFLYDTGLATAFMILRATELGLVAHPIAGFLEQRVKQILKIPDDMVVIALLVIGSHSDTIDPSLPADLVDDENRRRERLAVDQFAFLNQFVSREPEPLTAIQVANYYNFPKQATGLGQRIAILEFMGGFLQSDMDLYFHRLNIPQPCINVIPVDTLIIQGPEDPGLSQEVVQQIITHWREPGMTFDSLSQLHAKDLDWDYFVGMLEATADIQIAGAIANGAIIDVYLAPNSPEGYVAAIERAIESQPTVISISWGMCESDWDAKALDEINAALKHAAEQHITVCCSSGDYGALNRPAAGRDPSQANVNFPASSPFALACGGTSLSRDQILRQELAWNSVVLGARRASGGGMSGFFPRPSYQVGLSVPALVEASWRTGTALADFTGRWLPDVAAHASSDFPYYIVLGGVDFMTHGTSIAAPLIAALLAVLSESIGHKIGWINERLYQGGLADAFRDIIEGNNDTTGTGRSYHASPGWDPCTGFGSPNGVLLLQALQPPTSGPGPIAD